MPFTLRDRAHAPVDGHTLDCVVFARDTYSHKPAIDLASAHVCLINGQAGLNHATKAFAGLHIEFVRMPRTFYDQSIESKMILIRLRWEHRARDLTCTHWSAMVGTPIRKRVDRVVLTQHTDGPGVDLNWDNLVLRKALQPPQVMLWHVAPRRIGIVAFHY